MLLLLSSFFKTISFHSCSQKESEKLCSFTTQLTVFQRVVLSLSFQYFEQSGSSHGGIITTTIVVIKLEQISFTTFSPKNKVQVTHPLIWRMKLVEDGNISFLVAKRFILKMSLWHNLQKVVKISENQKYTHIKLIWMIGKQEEKEKWLCLVLFLNKLLSKSCNLISAFFSILLFFHSTSKRARWEIIGKWDNKRNDWWNRDRICLDFSSSNFI